MNTLYYKTVRSMTIAVLTLIPTTLSAQFNLNLGSTSGNFVKGNKTTGSWGKSYGIDEANGSVDLYGFVRRKQAYLRFNRAATQVTAYGRSRGVVELFGHRLEAARVQAKAFVRDGTWQYVNGQLVVSKSKAASASLGVWVAGNKLVDDPVLSTTLWKEKWGPFNVLPKDLSTTFYVYGVPITVGGNIGVGFDVELTGVLDIAKIRAGLEGKAGAHGLGYGFLAIGIDPLKAGVDAKIKFANLHGTLGVFASPAGLSGEIGYSIEPLGMKLSVFAEVSILGVNIRKDKTIFDWSMNAIGGRIPLF